MSAAKGGGGSGPLFVPTTATALGTTAPNCPRLYPLRVYLAGKYADRVDLGAKKRELEAHRCVITHDWMTYELGERGPKQLACFAAEDIRGIATADLVVAVMTDPAYAYRGTFTELGAALGLRRQVIVVAPAGTQHFRGNVFWHHPDILHVSNWAEALEAVDALRKSHV
jgi:hypothetical protein